jgi:hypothetical protein
VRIMYIMLNTISSDDNMMLYCANLRLSTPLLSCALSGKALYLTVLSIYHKIGN